ncbi:hypothetical protein ACFSSC_00925 [Corynebacterium mendelii]|uniref:Uncharacterized protein n=1 Tax=Corynebacterium mendelii TaxID=2765362 RepID=A0A939E102_9CORY|nr:hypothetical protein [Corynebacterium mendelii]MBN9643848.1 hypothetical protein [Corynebacterium mendelii]
MGTHQQCARRAQWAMTPLAWIGAAVFVLYWAVLISDVYDIGPEALSTPLDLFGEVAYFLFFLPVTVGLVISGVVGWRTWKHSRCEVPAGIAGILLLLSFPMVLVLTAGSLMSH